ncbi:MAG: FAD:protein FMN transferase [Acidobacteria bacterium]|nr:FAD:protein FMN transferase [Acidobacteriota bacterium]
MYQRREILKLAPKQTDRSDAYWLHVSRTAMACRFEITLPVQEQSGVKAASAVLSEAERLEQQLSVFRDDSEVSLINRNAAAQAVTVDHLLFALLIQCLKLSSATEDAFDITSSPLSRCWGFLRRQGRIPTIEQIEEARLLTGSELLRLDVETRTVRFDHAGMEINLGSIGKGYALDRMAKQLRGDVLTALLSAGSSSFCALGHGEKRKGWTVGIRHPLDVTRRLAVLRLRDAAMATSGSEEQYFECDGKRYGHIIDPRTGWPADGVVGVTVVTASAAVADALTTAFYIGGRALAERYCEAHPGTLVVMLESEASLPVIIGQNENCEVEILHD